MNRRNVPVFRIDVANALLVRGYKIDNIRKNYTSEGSVVFMFEPDVTKEIIKEVVEEVNFNKEQ